VPYGESVGEDVVELMGAREERQATERSDAVPDQMRLQPVCYPPSYDGPLGDEQEEYIA
jgi:hypothetical protein